MQSVNKLINLQSEDIDDCVLCENSVVTEDVKYMKLLGLLGNFGVKKCAQCNLRWLSPRPTEEAYKEVYTSEEYFNGENALEDYSALAQERMPYFKSRIIKIEKIMRDKDTLRILDIGAATGEFILEANKRGHVAEGIEFSEYGRKYAEEVYGIKLTNKSLTEIENNKFDVIHLNHVFEHLQQPQSSLVEFRRLLRKDGMLVLEVPQQLYNDLDRVRRVLTFGRSAKFNAYSLHHTYFFNPDNISKLIRKCNFEVIEISTYNKGKTPLWPFSFKNALLKTFLWSTDKIHNGGNIIEVFARVKG